MPARVTFVAAAAAVDDGVGLADTANSYSHSSLIPETVVLARKIDHPGEKHEQEEEDLQLFDRGRRCMVFPHASTRLTPRLFS